EAENFPAMEQSRKAYKLVSFATGSPRVARTLAPNCSTVQLSRNYDLFFPAFNHTYELYSLATIPDWRKRSRVAACFITEIWPHLLPRYLLEMLREFDHIFTGFSQCVDEVSRIVGRPCTYLPVASNVLRFAPTSLSEPRLIDVCNIGRRSAVTHEALLKLADERKIFYYYDTVAASGEGNKQRTFRVDNASEHRRMFANLLRHSRYYIANRSRINEPELTQGKDEISSRYYEGAAAGTVMLGEVPRTAEFATQFDWPDAVIHLPFDSPDIGRILADIDADQERIARIRRQNIQQAALRHDWVHRLQTVFDMVGIKPTSGMIERQSRLQGLAGQLET
ncbi:MAG: glycosyltransferase, partial [Steroidobacteraceae bacterium]